MLRPSGVTGVLLAAGNGLRMRRLVVGPKACLPICNQPLIAYHLGLLDSIGIHDVVLVVGFQAGEVMATARTWAPPDMRLRYVEQPHRKGIAQALSLVRGLVGAQMVVVLADTYVVPGDLGAGLTLLSGNGGTPPAAVLSIRRGVPAARIRAECSVRFDPDGNLVTIREKPAVPFNDLKPCGVYFLTDAIFEAIAATAPSSVRGEVELTDALQRLVDLGHPVRGADTVRWDVNVNDPADLLAANLAELRRRRLRVITHPAAIVHPGATLSNVIVGARAQVGPDTQLRNVVVLPGSVVGPGRRVSDAVAGRSIVAA